MSTTGRDPQTRGFTLIELLVVVAVIAILAAIALPNFLEAQTRAKVARVKADIRTLATGMEAYAADNNRYPWCDPEQDHSYLADIPMLTTPVAYMTNLPADVFPPEKFSEKRQRFYRYYPMDYWRYFYPGVDMRNWRWIVMSNAPDREINVDLQNAEDAIRGNYWMVYNPTNGTISFGDVWATNLGIIGGGV